MSSETTVIMTSSTQEDNIIQSNFTDAVPSALSQSSSMQESSTLIIFRGFVVAIGVIGVVANSLVCSVMIQIERKKRRTSNLLILNQLCLDLFASIFLIPTYMVNLANIYLEGQSGMMICIFLTNEFFPWIGLYGSVNCIVMIALERYVKVVHAILHKKYFRKWMVSAAVAFCWVDSSLLNYPIAWVSSGIDHSQCFYIPPLPNAFSYEAYVVFIFTWQFFLPLVVLFYCYVRILIVIRRQAKFHGGNNPAENATNENDERVQTNIIKTTS